MALSIGTDRELSCNPVAMPVSRPSSGIVSFDMMAGLAGAARVGRLDDFTARLFAVLKTAVGQTVLSRRSTHTMSASFRTNRRLAIHWTEGNELSSALAASCRNAEEGVHAHKRTGKPQCNIGGHQPASLSPWLLGTAFYCPRLAVVAPTDRGNAAASEAFSTTCHCGHGDPIAQGFYTLLSRPPQLCRAQHEPANEMRGQ